MAFKAKLTALTIGAVLATTAATAALGQGMQSGPAGGPMHGQMPGPMGAFMGPGTFSKIDTNGDKVLSRDEIRAYIAAQVKGLDANGDGVITQDELTAKMTEMRKTRMEAMAAKFIDRFGKDGKVSVDDLAQRPMPMDRMINRMLKVGDGKISKSTFEAVEAMGGFDRHGPGARMGDHKGDRHAGRDNGPRSGMHGSWHGMRGAGGLMRHEMPKFSDIDTNGDGFITADEIAAYKLARIKAIDTNGDGFITPEEFATYAVGKMEPGITARAAKIFATLDLNADGKVTIEELAAAPLDMMFARLPMDKNGNVTEQAFMRTMAGPGRGHGPREMRGHEGWRGRWQGHGDHMYGNGRRDGGWGMMPPPPPMPDQPEGN